MQLIKTTLPDVVLIQPKLFKDERGIFFESYNKRAYAMAGISYDFVQDNQSISHKNVLRGLHYQIIQPQAKLVRVVKGAIFDVAVDLRKDSPYFGKWVGAELSADNKLAILIPPWFAHGFLALSEATEVLYKASDFYAPQHERCIRWDDPQLAIDWPLEGLPIVTAKDVAGSAFVNADVFS